MDNTSQLETTPMEAPNTTKRIIKKKVVNTTQSEPDQVVDNVVDCVGDEKDSGTTIPSSRIKNYINKEKLNKEIDQLIEQIKTSGSDVDLNALLSEEVQKKVGAVIKEKQTSNSDAAEINIKDITVDVLSKMRFKFSNNSFKILAAFSDMVIEEITKYAMDEIVKSKKSIITTRYVFNENISSGRLYNIYSNLPTFVAMRDSLLAETVVEETPADAEQQVDSVSADSNTKSINFEFYVRKICNKLKETNESYSNIKVSGKYQKFCSNIILDLLDKIAPLSKIVLEVMSTKTITYVVFKSILKMQLFGSVEYESIVEEMENRASEKLQKKKD